MAVAGFFLAPGQRTAINGSWLRPVSGRVEMIRIFELREYQSMSADPCATIKLDIHTRVGFISDLHLGPQHPEIEVRFRTFLSENQNQLDVLFILGDLFEYWIGDDAAELCGHLSSVHALRNFLHHSNCRVFLMHGNRDFLLGDDFCQSVGCERIPDPCVLNYGGTRIVLSHGDRFCTDDLDHQEFRAMVLNPLWQHQFLAKTPSERLSFAIEARALSESGKAEKSMVIMDVNTQAIECAMRAHQSYLMIHGHTHRPAVHSMTLDDKDAFRIVLNDWFESGNLIKIENGEIMFDLEDAGHRIAL